MQQSSFKVRFTTPCLGNVRPVDQDPSRTPSKMITDGDGRVIFMNTWWKSAFREAARSLGRGQSSVSEIKVDPIVDGRLDVYDRVWTNRNASPGERHGVTRHEAFLTDTVVACRALVPDDLTEGTFRDLLNTVGTFIGISPYGHQRGFGRFVLEDVHYGTGSGWRRTDGHNHPRT